MNNILQALLRWNRWGSAILDGKIFRDITKTLVDHLETPEVLVLIGPRRAGKTTVLFQLMDNLEKNGVSKDAMLHVNFEEPALGSQLNIDLLENIYHTYRTNVYPQGKAYLFFDEIQNVANWERWVRSRNETEEVKIIVTGSSAHLMSRELGTLLTGRHLSFTVFPLNFAEFLRFRGITLPKKLLQVNPNSIIENALKAYLTWGGFPAVVLAKDDNQREQLLKQYFDDILFKDIAMRYKIRDIITLRNLATHLLAHTGSLMSLQRIAKLFGVSLELAGSYCSYLQEAFLINFVGFYSRKVAERNRNPKKVYSMDLGLRRISGLNFSDDIGHRIETAVHIKLLSKKQMTIFYWKDEQKEIDFVIHADNKASTLIQVVSEHLEKPEVLHREYEALIQAAKILKVDHRTIVVGKMPTADLKLTEKIDITPLWLFLLRQ